jgi:hypothetical protein
VQVQSRGLSDKLPSICDMTVNWPDGEFAGDSELVGNILNCPELHLGRKYPDDHHFTAKSPFLTM